MGGSTTLTFIWLLHNWRTGVPWQVVTIFNLFYGDPVHRLGGGCLKRSLRIGKRAETPWLSLVVLSSPADKPAADDMDRQENQTGTDCPGGEKRPFASQRIRDGFRTCSGKTGPVRT